MLSELLAGSFIKDYKNVSEARVRLRYGVLSGCVGLASNIIMCAAKFIIGLVSGSVAVMTDAVNNLSDAGSSVVTVVSFRLAGRRPNNAHPFGYGRVEYAGGLIISVIIISLGFNFFKESFVRIIHPSVVKLGLVPLIVLLCTLLVKVWLFFFYRFIGRQIKSEIIYAAAADNFTDMIGTVFSIAAIEISQYTGFCADGYASLVLSCFLLYTGYKIFRKTLDVLIGLRPDHEIVKELENVLMSCEGVKGVHDIILHNYGPNSYYGTAHAEMEKSGSRTELHNLLEKAEVTVAKKLSIHLVLHPDPEVCSDMAVIKWRGRLENIVVKYDERFKVYDFELHRFSDKSQSISCHILIPRFYSVPEEEITRHLASEIKKYGDCSLAVKYFNAFV